MRLKLIACNVFQREACHCLARTPHLVDVDFVELGEHVHPDRLRVLLQERIDAAASSAKNYEAVLLLLGLCGNATAGLRAVKAPLVLPRAHDCCTILLGSRRLFQEQFADNPSTPFSSVGYMERGDYYLRQEDGGNRMHFGDGYAALVEQYGEENAKYVWDAMHPQRPERQRRAVFIDVPETAQPGCFDRFRTAALQDGKEVVRLNGSLRLIEGLIFGKWNPDDFLVVPPGQAVKGVYDWVEIVRASPAG